MKGHDRLDGCATFFRTSELELLRVLRFEHQDVDEPHSHSGHVAQILLLQNGRYVLGPANTRIIHKEGTICCEEDLNLHGINSH